MSVIIHGMEMPKAGQTIEIAENQDGKIIGGIFPTGKWFPLEERKSGKWIEHCGDTICSECKTLYKDLEYILDDGYPKFCPNCGANMNGGENDER